MVAAGRVKTCHNVDLAYRAGARFAAARKTPARAWSSAAAQDVKLREADYDARISGYLIAQNGRKFKCVNDGLAGGMNDAIEKLTGVPERELAAEGATRNVDSDKLRCSELERFQESTGRRIVCR